MSEKKSKFPKRAIVTAGMPNGNKELHIGHISTFIWADCFARFMRNAIGADNVVFTSATDSYGSMVVEKAKESNSSEDAVVEKFHTLNKNTLIEYGIGLDYFLANCIDPLKKKHKELSNEILEILVKNGSVEKKSSLVFYDEKLGMFLNGRQVTGRCPVPNCSSEEAYADECALGHPYNPVELLEPVSRLSGTRPVLRESSNYYFDLERHRDFLVELKNNWEKRPEMRPAMLKEMKDFLRKPCVHLHKGDTIEYSSLLEREKACEELTKSGIRFRKGKTLTPFRMTGNSAWGVPVLNEDMTFYVWAESSWAHIASTMLYLGNKKSKLSWKDFWCDKESATYQIIGEDNVYFYSLFRPALFKALDWGINTPIVISNKHTLLGGVKAASSGKRKAPTASELLAKYTPEQIKMYFLWQNVPNTTAEFKSKAFFPEMFGKEEDPFLQGGNILTNIFNRIIRQVFYTLAKSFDNKMPYGEVSKDVYEESLAAFLAFEKNIMNFDLNKNISLLDTYLRNANKRWSRESAAQCKKQILVDTLFVVKAGIMMLHSVVPANCEVVADKLNLEPAIFLWKNINKPIYEFSTKKDFSIQELEPKFDFFKKHPSQFV